MKRIVLSIVFALCLFNVKATTYYSRASGPWTTSSTWSLTSGGAAIPSGYPGVGDDVIIEGGFTVTIASGGVENLSAANVTIGSTTNGTLSYPNWNVSTLTISGDLTIGGSTGSGTLSYSTWGLTITCNRLLKGTGNAIRSNALNQDFTFTGTFTLYSGFNQFRNFIIDGGTVTLSSNIETNGSTSPTISVGSTLDLQTYVMTIGGYKNFNINGTLIVGGNSGGIGNSNFPNTFETLSIGASSSVVYSYAGNQTIYAATYNNLTLSGGGTKTTSGGTVTNLNLNSGGSNYFCGADLIFSGGGGTGASGTASEDFDSPYGITNVDLTSGGYGYTSAPSVSVSGNCGGSGASVTATISTPTVTVNGLLTISSCALNVQLNNLSLGGSASAVIDATGVLNISAGTVNFNGRSVTLQSNASGTGKIGTISGTLSNATNVTIQRFVAGKAARKWSFVASPINASIRNAWQQQVFITGPGTGGAPNCTGTTTGNGGGTDIYNSNGFDVSQFNSATVYGYDGSQLAGSRWISVSNTSTTLTPGKGYRLNVRGTRGASDANCSNLLYSPTPNPPDNVTLSVTGSLTTGVNMGDVTVTLDGTTGDATLLGNPYPAPIDFSSFYTDNNTLNTASYYLYSPLNSAGTGTQYTTYNALTTVMTNRPNDVTNYPVNGSRDKYIAVGQSFFVHKGSNGSVTFKESHKADVQTGTFRTEQINSIIRTALHNADGSVKYDEIANIFYNGPGVNINQVTAYDSRSLNEGAPVLVSLKGTERLAIQTRPLNFTDDTVKLGVNITTAGNYQLRFSEFENFSEAGIITLRDKYLNTGHDIKINKIYSFTVNSDAASKGDNRFEIVFKTTPPLPVNYISIAAKNKGSKEAAITWKVSLETNTEKYEVERSAEGHNFTSIGYVKSNGTNQYLFTDPSRLAGVSYYRIKEINKNGASQYSPTVKLNSGVNETRLSLYPNPVKDVAWILLQDVEGDYNIKIASAEGKLLLHQQGSVINGNIVTINFARFAPGLYMVEVTDTKGNRLTGKLVKIN